MKKKKVIKIIAVSLLIAAVAGGGIAGGIHYKNSKNVVEVYSVANLNPGDMGDSMTSSGVVCDDASQSVYLTDGQKVTDVYVEQGQQVKEGDKLMTYDVTSLSLSIEMKQSEIQSYENQLSTEKEKLEKLKATKPVEKKETVQPDTQTPSESEDTQVPDTAQEDISQPADEQHDTISGISQASSGDGTKENPYVFECTNDTYVSGALLNYLAQNKSVAMFKADAALVMTVYGEYITETYDDADELHLFPEKSQSVQNSNDDSGLQGTESEDTEQSGDASQEAESQASTEESGSENEEQTYTAEELKTAISEQARRVSSTDLAKRMAEAELKELNDQLEDGTVYAKADGVVTTVGDPQNPPQDGSAFLQISGKEGLYISGTIAELDLETVKVGQTVTATDYETGNSYSGTITQIGTVPADSNGYYGDNNPNSSYYPYTAYIKDTTGLKKGQYLDLTIDTATDENTASGLYISQGYVKDENGQSYVYKEENGKLVKQKVKTGKSLWGSYIEIKSGITDSDYIAFPYGVSEGEKVKESDDIAY